jgi:hypothetical protein
VEIKPVEDQQTIINRNVARWQEEQRQKELKRQKLAAIAQKKGVSVKALLSERRERYLLKSGRATIASIIASHTQEEAK